MGRVTLRRAGFERHKRAKLVFPGGSFASDGAANGLHFTGSKRLAGTYGLNSIKRNHQNGAALEANNSLITEVESAISSGSADRRVETLRRVTDLFMLRADNYSDDQVDLFDDVISRLAVKIEEQARAELAKRLAPVARAPIAVIRSLARDESIVVAAPVLTHSPRLTEEELLSIARGEGQDRLLAISKRVTVSEAVSDVLVTRGNRDVLYSVVSNDGARFSHAGFGKLVERSAGDDELSASVGLRKDIPKEHLRTLVSKASEAVFKKIADANPAAANEVNKILFDLTGHKAGTAPLAPVQRDFTQAKAHFEALQKSGKPLDQGVQQFAAAGRYEEVVVAVASLCQLPVESVDRIFTDKTGDNDLALQLIKASEMRWSTAKLILDLRRGDTKPSPAAVETARVHFERLQTATAKRVVRFYQVRRASGEMKH